MKVIFTALAFLLAGAATAIAEPPGEVSLQERAEAMRAQTNAPAIAILVMDDGQVLGEAAAGVRSTAYDIAAAPGDRWHLGSITKSMTATLVARLVEAGEIDWDLTIGDALGQAIPDMHPDYEALTFGDLLTHTSGLPANIGMFKLLSYDRTSPDARAERLDYAATMLAVAPRRPAGEAFEYSNAGYVVAGAMLEQEMGARWEDLVTAYVFAPLGLESAGFGPAGSADVVDQPRGHAPLLFGMGRRPISPGSGNADNPEVLGPAGRVHMTLEDLATYATAHLTGTMPDGAPFLSDESLARLHTPRLEDYAMGWIVQSGTLWHNGSNTLNYAEIYADSGTGLVIAMAANDHDAPGLRGPFRDAARTLLTAYSD